MIKNPKYRRGRVGEWILVGKPAAKKGSTCYVCRRELTGEQLLYYNMAAKKRAFICQRCVDRFEKLPPNPITARYALDLINQETMKAYNEASKATGSRKAKLIAKYRNWQSGLEVAEEIYHSGDKDALERIMAIKLHLKLSNPKHGVSYDRMQKSKYCSKCKGRHSKSSKLYDKHSRYLREDLKTWDEIERELERHKNLDLYESFHGVVPVTKRKVYYEPPPKEVIAIGELKQINYKPIRGKHKNTEFYHESGDTGDRHLATNLILATDKEGKNLYLVKKDKKVKRPYFTSRGIIG